MGAAGIVALIHFLRNLDGDSAIAKEASGGKAAEWNTHFKSNAMIADIYDAIQALQYTVASMGGGKPNKPKPYPRPWAKGETKKFGKDPVPISKFWDWWTRKEKR